MSLLSLVAMVVVAAVTGRDFDRSVETILEREKHQFVDDPEFDHEAFLGKDIADDFDDLTVEQSKAKLAEMLPKVDTDSDGEITKEELEKWISDQIQEYIKRDSTTSFPNDDTDGDGKITWDEYVTSTFGEGYVDLNEGMDYYSYVMRDKARFDLADLSADGSLDFDEFCGFLHPEEYPHMAEAVVDDTLDDMDEDGDGKVSLLEYLGDFVDDEDENEKEWIEQEKESFVSEKDKDKDGYLDRDELAAWVIPLEKNFSGEEAASLIEKADTNKDGTLSFQEIVENHSVFVGSQATDYGRLLHEEL